MKNLSLLLVFIIFLIGTIQSQNYFDLSTKYNLGVVKVTPNLTSLGTAKKKNTLVMQSISLMGAYRNNSVSISTGIGHKTISGTVNMVTHRSSTSLSFIWIFPIFSSNDTPIYHAASSIHTNYRYINIPFNIRFSSKNDNKDGVSFTHGPAIDVDINYRTHYTAEAPKNTEFVARGEQAFEAIKRQKGKTYLGIRYDAAITFNIKTFYLNMGLSIPLLMNSQKTPIGKIKNGTQILFELGKRF